MNLKPLKDQVLVKVDPQEEKSKGGLFIVNSEPVVKSSGFVVAVGDHPIITVKVGDHVLMEKSTGRRFDIPVTKTNADGHAWTDKEEYVLISFFDILALLED